MKMLASIKTRRAVGRAAKSSSDDRELLSFSDFPDNLRVHALQDPRCLLYSTLPNYLQQHALPFLKG
jgi:hypothetical protein